MDSNDAAKVDAIRALLFGSDTEACIRALWTQLHSTQSKPFAGEVLADGAGVYLLYYAGGHPLYNGLTLDCPIYIGKAVELASRLKQHRKSVQAADNLRVEDFVYKVLRINEEWVAGCESVLIRHWQPLWNTVVRGFGNHAPGSGRKLQRKSLWTRCNAGSRRPSLSPSSRRR